MLTLLMLLSILLFGEQYIVNGNQNEVNLISTDAQSTVLEMTLGHFNREAVRINDQEYWALTLKKEGITLEAGMPQLPYVTRSIIIPGNARMTVSILEEEYVDIQMPIAPSKGNLTRDINPDTVPYVFDGLYQSNEDYPAELARLSEPFIMRDYRGITVYFQPFVYYPQTQTLRIYTRLKLAVSNSGIDNVNVMSMAKNSASKWFDVMYQRMFINYNQAKYPVLEEQGRILVVTNSMFNSVLQPYVNWKRQKGFVVNVVDIATVGPTATQLKTYVQSQYDLNNGLTFLQIMGDHPQVPSLTSGSAASDPSFSLLAGNDNYPDIFVGRFSAQTLDEMVTQITRTVHYERDMQGDNPWLATGMGIASNEGGGSTGDLGESDQQHIENIRQDLLAYGYTSVDQVYQAMGATAAMVSNGVNAGRGFINYCGHGSSTTWVTTGFSNTNVNQLTNDYKLPFIVSVACVNGDYANQTCFAEAWLRARDSVTGNPRGAIAFYGSTINMAWNPPMRGQDEITDLLVANQKNTIGGLYFNGSSKMTEVYGTNGFNEFKCWTIFGDASLMVRTANPTPLTAQYSDVLFLGMDTFTVQTNPGAWVTLSANGETYGTAYANSTGNATLALSIVPDQPMDLTLTITAFNKITHIGIVEVIPSSGPYIQVAEQLVSDGNNNIPEYGETISYDLSLFNIGTAMADNIAAHISSVDPYITILNNVHSFGDIDAGESISSTNAFSIQIANNVPDQHAAVIHVTITLDGVITWQYNLSLVINAPAFTAGAIVINDSGGNNNGRIDPGETFNLVIPVTNSGHAATESVLFSLLITNHVNYILSPIANTFTTIQPNETVQVIYEITFSSQIPAGMQAQFILMGIAGQYSLTQSFTSFVGLVMENFESGGFTAFPWEFAGGNWTIDNSTYYAGGSSAKSFAITHSQSTSMTVTMEVPAAGNITFYKKVSSEQNYDYLKFYVNNVLKGQWSGNVDWSQESYNVNPGTTTFKWEYVKDYIVSSGSDCAWVDEINFPSTGGVVGTPIFEINTTSVDFGTHIAAEFEPALFTITNDGDATMIGTVMGNNIFKVKPASLTDYANMVNYVIPAGLSMNFHVMIFPTAEGTYNGELNITSDDPLVQIYTVPLTAVVLPTSAINDNAVLVNALKGNFPNPFNPETTVSFSIKQDSKVSIDIYNILGQKVKTLVSENLRAGNHAYKWNGKDDNGNSVSSGIYFYRMNAGSFSSTAKMVLMK